MLLLDEPTNNLDASARERLYAAVGSWPGVALVVSHDRRLLSLVDQVAELSGGALRLLRGNLEAYEAMIETEQAAAQRAVTSAGADLRRERRDLIESQVKQATRDRQGRAVAASGSLPRIIAGGRKRAAQVSAGRTREVALSRVADARERLAEAEEARPRRGDDPDLAARDGGASRADRADGRRARRAVGAVARTRAAARRAGRGRGNGRAAANTATGTTRKRRTSRGWRS